MTRRLAAEAIAEIESFVETIAEGRPSIAFRFERALTALLDRIEAFP